jgi:putative chitinase
MLESQLLALGIDGKWLEPLKETFEKYGIDTAKRQAAFIGQCMHESGGFKLLEENLNYSAKALMATWPSRFPTEEMANQYARNPEKIANKVYGGRMGNGTEETGEGWKYRGRGIKQLTGKENYDRCGSGLGVDLVGNPDLLLEPKYAALSAGWFWNKHNLNDLADKADIETMTKRINGGLLGLDARKAAIQKAESVLG